MRRRLISIAVVTVVALGLTAAVGLAAEPAIEATGTSPANYAWTPSSVEVDGGGAVAFKNPTANPHGLAWESGPETPSCTGTSSIGKANWSGSCTFAQGGTYKFYCPVHPSVMKGTVNVTGPRSPVVSTGSASGLGEAEATLNGTVNPSEQETTYFFEYGTTTAYGQKTPEASAGSGNAPVAKSATVAGLSAATTYHFRLVAKNATGTTLGSDRAFTTTGGPPGEPPSPPAEQPTPPTSAPSPSSPTRSPPAALPAPPETRLTLKPRAKTSDRTPTFKFASTTPGATFRCSIDRTRFKVCRSPYTTASLKPGRHRLRVAAVAGGQVDPTPASWSFKVIVKKK